MSPIPGIIASSQTAATLSSFESIATATGTGSSNTITFSSIPSGYSALQIRFIGKSTQTGTAARYIANLRFNSDTGSNYASHTLRGDGNSVSATGAATQTNIIIYQIPNSATAYANMHTVGIIDIIDYTSTAKAKTIRVASGLDLNTATASNNVINLSSGLWYATPAAITSISIVVPTGSWTTTSSFALYGVK